MADQNSKKEDIDLANFDWQKLENEIRTDSKTGMAMEETSRDKLWRKMRENPAVPIGTGITTTVLIVGVFCFATKRTRMSQIMMRARVAAQGFTIFALTGSVVYQALNN